MKPLLVYDGDCAFCASSARWLKRRGRRRIEVAPFGDERAPSTLAHDRAHLVTDAGTRSGGAAITGALRTLPGGRLFAFLDLPVIAWMRDRAYALVVRHRTRIGRWLRLHR